MNTNKLLNKHRSAPFLTLLATCFIGCGGPGDVRDVSARSKSVVVNESEKATEPTSVATSEPAARFELTDQEGNQFDSADLQGKVWMGSVFFANCPGPCFRENQAIADILREIDDPNFVLSLIHI